MDLNNWPEDVGDGKDNVLVGDIEKGSLVFVNPVVSLHSATAGTKPGFASEVNLFCQLTAKALVHRMPETGFALKNFSNIDEDGVTDTPGVFINKSIPVVVGAKNISN